MKQPQLPRFGALVGRLSVPIGEIRGSKSRSWWSCAEQGVLDIRRLGVPGSPGSLREKGLSNFTL